MTENVHGLPGLYSLTCQYDAASVIKIANVPTVLFDMKLYSIYAKILGYKNLTAHYVE